MGLVRGVLDEGLELAHAGGDTLEGEAEAPGGRLGLGGQRRIVALGQIDEPSVVAEIERLELRVAVEAEALDDQRLELPGQKVGEVEGAGLGQGQAGKAFLPGEGRIAMRAGQARHPLLLEHPVESTAGATIGIGDDHPGMGLARRVDGGGYRLGDLLRSVVQGRRQAAQVEMRQPVGLDDGDDLASEGAAGNDGCALHGRGPDKWGCGIRRARAPCCACAS